jgi:hypothetical protein
MELRNSTVRLESQRISNLCLAISSSQVMLKCNSFNDKHRPLRQIGFGMPRAISCVAIRPLKKGDNENGDQENHEVQEAPTEVDGQSKASVPL